MRMPPLPLNRIERSVSFPMAMSGSPPSIQGLCARMMFRADASFLATASDIDVAFPGVRMAAIRLAGYRSDSFFARLRPRELYANGGDRYSDLSEATTRHMDPKLAHLNISRISDQDPMFGRMAAMSLESPNMQCAAIRNSHGARLLSAPTLRHRERSALLVGREGARPPGGRRPAKNPRNPPVGAWETGARALCGRLYSGRRYP